MPAEKDEVDRIVEAWGQQRPDLDFSPLEDRAKVEARRAALKMPPLDAYKRMVLDMQHCPAGASGDHHYAPGSPARDQVKRK